MTTTATHHYTELGEVTFTVNVDEHGTWGHAWLVDRMQIIGNVRLTRCGEGERWAMSTANGIDLLSRPRTLQEAAAALVAQEQWRRERIGAQS